MVLELNQDNFEKEVVESELPVLVDFWASWCGPCKMLGPVFEELSGEFAGKVKFAKVSTEEAPEIAQQSNVSSIPALLLFKEGKEVDRIVGFLPKSALKEKIEGMLEG